MTRNEIIDMLHFCVGVGNGINSCGDCSMKSYPDCLNRIKLAAAAMLEDDAVDSTAEKRERWEEHGECNDGCIHYEDDEEADTNSVCNKCLGTVLCNKQNWEREDYYSLANESEIQSSSSEIPNNSDSVRPSHYKTGAAECIEAIKASMDINEFAGFLKGNVLKYIWRYEKKGGIDDLYKAQTYLEWLIEVES